MEFWERISGRGTSSINYCTVCRKPMRIVTGQIIRTSDAMNLMGCFQCGVCKRVYCWDHSDARNKCICGNQMWISKDYLPE